MDIGTLNERGLHRALKSHYIVDGDQEEIEVDGFVVDIVTSDRQLIEIQTTGFSSIKGKLNRLLEKNRVLVVHPIAGIRHIIKLQKENNFETVVRRSPKKGRISHIVNELVSIPDLLNHPNFSLEVVLVEEEEYRVFDPSRTRRRQGWTIVGRELIRILDKKKFQSSEDLFGLLLKRLPKEFTTADLAIALGEPRFIAQRFAYCLRKAGSAFVCGKDGNALVYQKNK